MPAIQRKNAGAHCFNANNAAQDRFSLSIYIYMIGRDVCLRLPWALVCPVVAKRSTEDETFVRVRVYVRARTGLGNALADQISILGGYYSSSPESTHYVARPSTASL